MAVPQVERIAQQCFVVGAGIQRHRDHPAGVDTGRGGVRGQRGHGDAETAATEITDARDLLGVAAHDDVDIILGQSEGGKGLLDVAGPVDRQVNPARVGVVVLADSIVSGAAINERQQFSQVIREHLEIERRVAVMKQFQKDFPGVGRL